MACGLASFTPQSTDKLVEFCQLRSAESAVYANLLKSGSAARLAALLFELTYGLGFALSTGTYSSKRRPCLR